MCDEADGKIVMEIDGTVTDFSIEFRISVTQATSCILLQLQDQIFKWVWLF